MDEQKFLENFIHNTKYLLHLLENDKIKWAIDDLRLTFKDLEKQLAVIEVKKKKHNWKMGKLADLKVIEMPMDFENKARKLPRNQIFMVGQMNLLLRLNNILGGKEYGKSKKN